MDENLDIHFARPALNSEKGVYVSRARLRGSGKPVRLHIREARIHATHAVRTENDQARGPMVLQVVIGKAEPVHGMLDQIDQDAVSTVIQENGSWFRNSLGEDGIRAMFRPAMCEHSAAGSLLSVLVSEQKGPIELVMDGRDHGSFRELVREGIAGRTCSLEIEAHGIFFYPNRCGIRWVLRRITVTRSGEGEEEILAGADRAEIEGAWREEVEEARARVEGVIGGLTAAMGRMDCILAEALERPGADKTWNQLLEQLRVEITKVKQIKNI